VEEVAGKAAEGDQKRMTDNKKNAA